MDQRLHARSRSHRQRQLVSATRLKAGRVGNEDVEDAVLVGAARMPRRIPAIKIANERARARRGRPLTVVPTAIRTLQPKAMKAVGEAEVVDGALGLNGAQSGGKMRVMAPQIVREGRQVLGKGR